MSEDESKEIREMAAEGKVAGKKIQDCKPGLYRELFTDPKDVAAIAGSCSYM